jgi:hypothetical protein
MEHQEALAVIRDILAPRKLSYIEELVICHSWEDKRYHEMSLETGYEEGYLKSTGCGLWQALSDCLGYQVTKKRLRYLLEQRGQPPSQESSTTVSAKAPNNTKVYLETSVLSGLERSLEYPGSPLPCGSPLYLKRPPIEELSVSAIQHPGGLLRIKAPWRMGKTSLMNYLLGQCRQQSYTTAMIDVRQADTRALGNLDAFFRWFCFTLNQQLNLPCDLNHYWFDDAGSKLNCTTHMQEHVLAQIDSPLAIAIDSSHYLTEHPVIAQNFFSMLRSWYELAKRRPQWQKLRLMLAYVADLELPLQTYQSPFNVGVPVELPYFQWPQIHKLQECYGMDTVSQDEASALESLVNFVGGHPYLTQLAFYWLQSGQISVSQILHTAATNQGIYREYLRRIWSAIHQKQALIEAFYQVLASPDPVYLNPKQAYALADMGLVELMGHQVKLRCELYRAYFCPLMELECG